MMKRKHHILAGSRSGWAILLAALLCVMPYAHAADDPPAAAPEAEAAAADTPAAEAAEPEKTEEQTRKFPPDWIHGSFNSQFETAAASGNFDVDLDETLRIKVDPPQWPKLHLSGALWMHEDLDGDEGRDSTLRDVDDTYDAAVQARLLSLHADIDDLWGRSVLRLGRQRIVEGPAFSRIDGVYFKQTHQYWDWYAFAGVRASVYSDSYDDTRLGGGASVQVLKNTRVGFDLHYGKDHREHGRDVSRGFLQRILGTDYVRKLEEDTSDTLIALNIHQTITPNWYAYGRFTVNDGDANELLLDVTGTIPQWDLTIQGVFERQMLRIEDRTSDLTVFYRVLGAEQTFNRYLISVHKPITQKLALSLEAEYRDAQHDETFTGNRDYWRGAVILSADEIIAGINAMVALEHYTVKGGENTWAVSGELNRRWGPVETALGVDFERYKSEVLDYNPYPNWINQAATYLIPGLFPRFTPLVYATDEYNVVTRENVYGAYAKAKWAMTKDQDLTAKLTFEEDEGPDSPYWRLRIAYDIRF